VQKGTDGMTVFFERKMLVKSTPVYHICCLTDTDLTKFPSTSILDVVIVVSVVEALYQQQFHQRKLLKVNACFERF